MIKGNISNFIILLFTGTENEQELRLDCYGGHMPNIFPLFF